ncbi:hypothetical protein SUGI_0441990 [Cryptomeria japonica]|uniref:3,9-dihydroxypterocarpan 6A-monooxygenase-like n=1 Tax=Cryptomeria japonica TaxID=3369 RepID=UPI002408A3FC|nr:3,9-dihydroxypterocarpan 6A-monooxygenase-like [Cryptomeria japonica]GLJ23359.1 hypothetical protein SUGI_0441990 [Cryptomeria japonica]
MDLAIVISLLSVLVAFTIFKIFFDRSKKSLLPPGPLALPLIGHLHLLGTHPHQAMQKLSLKYGPLMQIRLGSVLSVVVSSPDMAKEFLKTHESKFASRPQSAATKYMAYNSADFSFAPYGPYWKYMRKICMNELLSGRQLDTFLPVRDQELGVFMETILKNSVQEKVIDVGSELISLACNVISRMTMSTRCSGTDEEAVECTKLVKEIALLTGKFNLGDFIYVCKNLDLQGYEKQMKDVHRRFDCLMEKILKQHEAEAGGGADSDGRPKDLIDILTSISNNEEAEMKLTRENIKAFILDIFAAGTDTSAISTEWAFSELMKNPHIMKKAREEVDFVVGSERLVEESDIPKMIYLQAIVKETLRLHSPGPITVRESTEDCNIEGYFIPAKTRVFVNIWAIGRDPNYWENPLEFQPERFLSNDTCSNIDVRGQHFHLIPFGSGRRGCPGTSLALYFMNTALAAMIQCFDWKVNDGKEIDMEEGVGLTLPRANPVECIATPRFSQLPTWKSS